MATIISIAQVLTATGSMITTTMQLRYVYYKKYLCNKDGKDKKSTTRVTCTLVIMTQVIFFYKYYQLLSRITPYDYENETITTMMMTTTNYNSDSRRNIIKNNNRKDTSTIL